MSMKKYILCLAAVVLLGGGGYGLHQYLASSATGGGEYRNFTNTFEADKETQAALTAYENGKAKPAKILKPATTSDKSIFLYFEGLPDYPLTESIVDDLEKAKGTAAFFAEGQNALDDEETMKLLQKKGCLIGNYTWLGRPNFEKFEPQRAIETMCKTQKAIKLMGGTEPSYFKAINTKYTDDLLKEIGACGLIYAVESTITVKKGEIKSQSDAEALVKKLKPGDFIAFEIRRPLDIRVKEQGKFDEKPAIDKKPTIKDDAKTEEVKKDTTAQQIKWLIAALTDAGYDLRDLKYAKSVAS